MMRTAQKIRVLVCNRYALFRKGIKELLSQGSPIEVVGEAATARQALRLVERLRPDVVLMDATMRDASGSEATRRIKALDPGVHILIVSLDDDRLLISGCLNAGATGYVRNGDRSGKLKSAIQMACRDGAPTA